MFDLRGRRLPAGGSARFAALAEPQRHPEIPASNAGISGYVGSDDVHFRATHTGARLNLMMFSHGKRIGVEFGRLDAPMLSPSIDRSIDGRHEIEHDIGDCE
jgi:hypothetical protein